MRKNWDIFCRVVDNYGDIGVCWRLARQLAAEHGLAVRLWLDDLAALAPLCAKVDVECDEQWVAGVEICRWSEKFPIVAIADVVIEAFACDLPASYRTAMTERKVPPVWINLEYLSAEDWVEGCHALASPQPPLTKYFFFPGFTAKTGGLLLESQLFDERDALQQPLPPHAGMKVSLFCYESAAVGALFEAWQAGPQPVLCFVPPGRPLAAVQRLFSGHGPWQLGALTVEPIPFLEQPDYDRLLWACDLNFVRGEDSFVRAQWANRPFVWQAYPQREEAHFEKLDAFLARYTAALPQEAASAVIDFFHAWNRCDGVLETWPAFAAQLPLLAAHNRVWAEKLKTHGDLAGNLVKICADKL